MPYLCNQSADEFLSNEQKSITLLGMSGIGKTSLIKNLPWTKWFKYSGDYRIATRYLGEEILDNIKRKAMEVPFIANLLRTDSIYICNNITFSNLKPLSTFLGKVGNSDLGGMELEEFLNRQQLHHNAELSAMRDVPAFIEKGRNIYGYQHFINDAGGSMSELEDEEIYKLLAKHTLIVYLKADKNMTKKLISRANSSPKPLFYKHNFFIQNLEEFCREKQVSSHNEINPDEFLRWVFPKLIIDRIPRYERIARLYGVTVNAYEVSNLSSEREAIQIIASALHERNKR